MGISSGIWKHAGVKYLFPSFPDDRVSCRSIEKFTTREYLCQFPDGDFCNVVCLPQRPAPPSLWKGGLRETIAPGTRTPLIQRMIDLPHQLMVEATRWCIWTGTALPARLGAGS